MIKKYKIEIDCANCANKIEEAINSELKDFINNAYINFVLETLTIDYQDNANISDLEKEIKKLGKKVDVDFQMEGL